MTNIEQNDLVGLTRDINYEMPKGLVGKVLESHEDGVRVEFPLPGKSLHAEIPKEDLKMIIGNLQVNE
jgi:hypothetical protein